MSLKWLTKPNLSPSSVVCLTPFSSIIPQFTLLQSHCPPLSQLFLEFSSLGHLHLLNSFVRNVVALDSAWLTSLSHLCSNSYSMSPRLTTIFKIALYPILPCILKLLALIQFFLLNKMLLFKWWVQWWWWSSLFKAFQTVCIVQLTINTD